MNGLMVSVCMCVCDVYLWTCLCAGDVESTQPTKMLMRLAKYIDASGEGEGGGGLKEWFLGGKAEVLDLLAREKGRQDRVRRESAQSTSER